MRVALLASGNPLDPRTWSGTPYHMANALCEQVPGLELIQYPFPRVYSEVRHRIRQLTRNTVDINWLSAAARAASQSTLSRLRHMRPDVVLAVANTPIASTVCTRYPTVHVSDATFALMRDYYQYFKQQREWIQRSGNAMEGRLIRSARACIYSSVWAAQSAESDYGADPERVHVVPFGCNLTAVPQDMDFAGLVGRDQPCSLLFIGVEWQRKGGDIALDTVMRLRAAGLNAHLHVVGVHPPGLESNDAVTFHGFVDKAQPAGKALMDELSRSAAFLLLPTRQDCTPMVLAEGNAFGIPAITNRTGGVGSVVTDGVNGYCLPEASGPEAYEAVIRRFWSDPAGYMALRASSRRQFMDCLNWPAWARTVKGILEGVVAEARDRPRVASASDQASSRLTNTSPAAS